jgi:hypothetical protein
MTMRVTITNDDQTRTARVRVRDMQIGADGKHTGACTENQAPTEIAPGASAEFYIHSSRDLVVEEQ